MAILSSAALAGIGKWAAANSGALIGAAGSIGTNVANGKMSKKQRRWNEKMMDKQNAWSVNMYNRFQSPEAQRNQMLHAGMNPLGQDMASGSIPASASPNDYTVPSFDNPVKAGLESQLTLKQMANIDSDTTQKYVETARTLAMTPEEVKNIQEDTLMKKEQINNLRSSGRLNDKQVEKLDIENKWIDILNTVQLQKNNSEIALNYALKGKTESERHEIDYKVRELFPIEKLLKLKDLQKEDALIQEIKTNTAKMAVDIGLGLEDLVNYAFNHDPNLVKVWTRFQEEVGKSWNTTKGNLKKQIESFNEWCNSAESYEQDVLVRLFSALLNRIS